ncbi:MAG TPA: VOC family protein [Rhizomicrobium sp.]|nr:VOC family protein [Rhizomicrobium sp.]
MARITGLGGVFFYSADPKALGAWYRDKLGLNIEDWGGAVIRAEGAGPPHGVWAPFEKDTGYFSPSSREFMVNFAVDDLDGFLAALEAKGVEVKGRQADRVGKFAWILDPDGTKIEFWQPAQQPSSN